MLTVVKKMILVRHGKTDWNIDVRFQGRTDIPLNEYGLEQARKTAERLKNAGWGDATVISSPLSRAMQTAREISENVLPMEGYSEISFGSWEGALVSDIRKSDKEGLDAWHKDGFFSVPAGAEKWEEIYSRVGGAVDECLARSDERMIIVAHGGILRVIMVKLLGLDPHTAWRLAVYNCSLSGVDVCRGVNNLVILNDTLHLMEGVENVPLNY